VLHIAIGLRHCERRKDDWNESGYLADELVAEAVARQLASSSERGNKSGKPDEGLSFFFLRGVNGKGKRSIDMIQRAIESK
jgi:hypothetical protein